MGDKTLHNLLGAPPSDDEAPLPSKVEIEANPAGGWRVCRWHPVIGTGDGSAVGYTTAHETIAEAVTHAVIHALQIPDGLAAYEQTKEAVGAPAS